VQEFSILKYELELLIFILKYHDFDNWELLASAQALMIYTLMRMIEGPNEDNDFDAPLLLSLNVCSLPNMPDRMTSHECMQ